MSDQEKKEKSTLQLVSSERRDWGSAGPEISDVVNKAMEQGERIFIMYVTRLDPKEGGGVQCVHNVFTRHSPRVTWLEFLMLLTGRVTAWTLKLFAE